MSIESCRIYASSRVSASLGLEALAVVLALWWRVWLADRSPALHAAGLPSDDVRGGTVSGGRLAPRVVLLFSRPWAGV